MSNKSTKKSLERFKYEVADELGVPLKNGYNGDLTGDVAATPLCSRGRPCDWCDYSFICCHETGVNEAALNAPEKPFEDQPQGEEKA